MDQITRQYFECAPEFLPNQNRPQDVSEACTADCATEVDISLAKFITGKRMRCGQDVLASAPRSRPILDCCGSSVNIATYLLPEFRELQVAVRCMMAHCCLSRQESLVVAPKI